jgi:NAD(P)-dependent dehydrogenase (short-subunit alcohol dehydrogenase family)
MNTTRRPIADLAGRSVLITGATGGLGSAIAANLAARGANADARCTRRTATERA